MEDVLRRLPPTLGENDRLESAAAAACAAYMGYAGCMFTGSGFTATLTAFNKVSRLAFDHGRVCVFLCDDAAHRSLQAAASQAARVGTGPQYSTRVAHLYNFRHNDMEHLWSMLNMFPAEDLICVAIEGLYRLVLPQDPLRYACRTAWLNRALQRGRHHSTDP